jgi:septum site-determining protein MinD
VLFIFIKNTYFREVSGAGGQMSIWMLASGKGGVGKTTITANLGVELSRLGKKVLLIDSDLAAGNLALHFGLKGPFASLHDILSGRRRLVEKAIHRMPKDVHLLPSGYSLQGFLRSDINLLPKVIEEAAKGFDITLIDSPPGISKNTIVPLKATDGVLLVTTPDLPSITVTVKVKGVAELLERKICGAIINRMRKLSLLKRRRQMKMEEVEARLGTETLGIIPEDENVWKATNLGKPAVIYKPKTPASRAFKELSLRVSRL